MKKIILLYETTSGNRPVERFLNTVPVDHRAKIVRNLELLREFGNQLGGGYIDYIKDGIWELRTAQGGNISRILYFSPVGDNIILLHGFIKKIIIDQNRKKDYLERFHNENA